MRHAVVELPQLALPTSARPGQLRLLPVTPSARHLKTRVTGSVAACNTTFLPLTGDGRLQVLDCQRPSGEQVQAALMQIGLRPFDTAAYPAVSSFASFARIRPHESTCRPPATPGSSPNCR